MSEIKIAIENCNNISKGVISLEEEKLNIRYGMNGTGKSTLSTAISLFSQGKPMDDLKPFGSDDEIIPTISIDGDIQGVRACLKNAFRKIYVTICGRFFPDEGVVAGYGNRIRAKYTAKWGVQIVEMIFRHALEYLMKNLLIIWFLRKVQ